MNDLPDFQNIQPPETTQVPPKKPRPKPARKAARPKPAAALPKRVPKKRKAKRAILNLVNPAIPKEFDVVQGIIKTMLLLDRTTAKSVANLLVAVFA